MLACGDVIAMKQGSLSCEERGVRVKGCYKRHEILIWKIFKTKIISYREER